MVMKLCVFIDCGFFFLQANASAVSTDKRLTQTIRKLVVERGIDNIDYISGYLDCMCDELEYADTSKRFKPSRAKIRALINHNKITAGVKV